ncbi:hypothetical protein ACQJBY_067986 [Aegilops geniculata]
MNSSWTFKQNKVFENALAKYAKDTPDFWQNVAREVGDGKSVEDVIRHYAKLEKDVDEPALKEMLRHDEELQNRAGGSSSSSRGGSTEAQRPWYLKTQ